jgi:uncharacterized protein YodC (DUF2158 family)
VVFVEGDVVVLKSGGPQMTVCTVNSKDIECDWFSGATAKRKIFRAAQLQEDKKGLELAERLQRAIDRKRSQLEIK